MEVLRQTLIRWDSAPSQATDRELHYEVGLQPKEKVNFCFRVSCDSDTSDHAVHYSQAKSNAHRELENLGREFPQISSSNSRFNDWLSR